MCLCLIISEIAEIIDRRNTLSGYMLKWLLCIFLCSFYFNTANAQQWSSYAGAGVGYDAFLRDKSILKYKSQWPFQVGGNIFIGGSYHTENGFNVFGDASIGLTRLQFPVPEVKKSRNFYEMGQLKFMIGSGPKISIGDKGNFLTPFIQLGAAYFTAYGSRGIGNDDQNVQVFIEDHSYRDRWSALCGAGIDWQFQSKVPSSINLQFIYTPINLFYDPISYTTVVAAERHDLELQGKLLQVILSWKVHFWVKNSTK